MSKEEAISLMEEIIASEDGKVNKVILRQTLQHVINVYANLERCMLDQILWEFGFLTAGYSRYPEEGSILEKEANKEKLAKVFAIVLKDVSEGLVKKCGCRYGRV
jgi:hypothetical protein